MGVARNIAQLEAGLTPDDLRAVARENAERLFPRLAALGQ